jgi:hypothetical protein
MTDADREARAREKLAAVRRALVERPDDPELRTWERRYEGILAGYALHHMMRRNGRWFAAWMRRH